MRLLISRFDVGNRTLGNITIRMTTGIPITGVTKGANRFSFIQFLKGHIVFVF